MATALPTPPETRLITADEFMQMDLGEGYFELIRGEVVRIPVGEPLHGFVCAKVAVALEEYGRRSGSGYALCNDPSILTERSPDTVRGVDVCYFSDSRWPRSAIDDGLPPVPPDLAVEVVTPHLRTSMLLKKVQEYLDVGVRSAWVAYPKGRFLVVYRPDEETPAIFRRGDVLDDLPELPGFRLPVADLFP